jgi:hypothetical protein
MEEKGKYEPYSLWIDRTAGNDMAFLMECARLREEAAAGLDNTEGGESDDGEVPLSK